jgi:hypothetical protein
LLKSLYIINLACKDIYDDVDDDVGDFTGRRKAPPIVEGNEASGWARDRRS